MQHCFKLALPTGSYIVANRNYCRLLRHLICKELGEGLNCFHPPWMEWKLQRQKPPAELPEYSIKNCCAALLLVDKTLYRRITSTFLTGFLTKYVSFHWIVLEITVFHQFQNAHSLPHFYIFKIRDILYKWWQLTTDWVAVMI